MKNGINIVTYNKLKAKKLPQENTMSLFKQESLIYVSFSS